jgi:hypothetical protein
VCFNWGSSISLIIIPIIVVQTLPDSFPAETAFRILSKSVRTQRIDESEAKTPPVHVRQRRLELHSGIVIEKLFQFNLN